MESFLQSIFGDALADERRLAIFTLPERRTRHFSSFTAAALWAREKAKSSDVYFGVGLAGKNHGRRNASEDVVAIGGLWADIDVVAPHRNGKPLPPSIDDARGLLARLPFAPSVLVNSGHGLHAYWLFKEPWILESDSEREAAAKIAKGWHGQVCAVAESLGWKVENLGDLARVLRLPGTLNHKGGEPVEVRVLDEHPDQRYNPHDFEPFEAAEPPPEEPAPEGLVLRADAEPPADKFSALVLACPAFGSAWNRKRSDLADQSQSAYDLSLANIAALNDWTDQEIANLLIAARRKHGEKPEKALRPDYVGGTIANARAAAREHAPDGVDLSGFKVSTPSGPRSLRQLVEQHPALRAPVIEGLLREGETMNVISAPKIGKALALDTPILTDAGWATMGELRPGMRVHACDGTLTEIVAVSEFMQGRRCYRVTTKSGASVVADEDHLWLVRQRDREGIVTTRDLAAGRDGRRWLLPVAAPLVRPAAKLALDPWLLGYWLGNGTAREGGMTINKLDIATIHEHILRAGFDIGRVVHKGGATTFTVLGLKPILREMRLLNNKHIPEPYLTASLEQRAELLAGLLDSDGYAATSRNGSGQVEFCSTDPTLAVQVFALVRSLGHKASFRVQRARFNGTDCGPKVRISFAASRAHSPFSLYRKTDALPTRQLSCRSRGDAIVSVEPVPSVPVRCIQVAHPTGTYLAGEALMVSHNSWLVIDLALSVARGGSWLGMACVPGEVLIIDNELHGETSANRIPRVASARGIPIEEVQDRVHIENLRGRLQDLFALGPYFRQFAPGRFKVVLLDAFYRFLPMKADENDNGTMANLYNYLDAYADYLKCSFVLIHHTSKGNQSLKELTDVGAGAGAQSRATDTHLVLRRHEEEDAVVLEAAVRSWPPVPPRCLRWSFPLWHPADDLDPGQLKQEGKRRAKPAADDDEPDAPAWTATLFVETLIGPTPKSLSRILEEAEQAGLSSRRARRFLELAEEDGRIHRRDLGQKRVGYSTEPEPPREPEPEPAPSRRDAVEVLLRGSPELTNAEIAERCGVSDRYVRRIRNEMEGSSDAE